MEPVRPDQPDEAMRLALAFGRALQFEDGEVQTLARYLRRIDAIEHELQILRSGIRGGGHVPTPHEGPGTWREPHPVRD